MSYEYDAAIDSNPFLTGGNTVDIGIFDQRGIDFLSAGFRGWSGSARQSFFIAPDEATPGYVPGPIAPGVWYIFLGFYKVSEGGCNFRVTVRCLPGGDGGATPPRWLTLADSVTLPPRPDGWYRGELHCHTCHSDGDSAPGEVVRAAERLGLDFLAVTDHNTITALADLAQQRPQNLILIPGCEMTTFKGHWCAWGLSEWIDFRALTTERMDRVMRHAAAKGALVSINHPRAYGPPWELPQADTCDCIEVWNGPWMLNNWEALAFWEKRLRQGRRLTAVGGSDAHRLTAHAQEIARIGVPTTWVYCPGAPTAQGILDGLRAGHAFVSEQPAGPQLYLSAGGALMGDRMPPPPDGEAALRVRAVGAAGLTLELHDASGLRAALPVAGDDETQPIPLDVAESRYVRAQLTEPGPGGTPVVRALTNPLYIGQP
ncbi:MAG: CehA/McbA family metallohydrolase [Anaerolineae bacterium]|nr:CehA/McbA family metallohydrolase [Anaerolineae bacterium]